LPGFPFTGASAAKIAANSPARYVPGEHALLHRFPMRAFRYQGSEEREQGFPQEPAWPQMLAFARELRAAGGQVTAAVYKGRHNWKLWRWHMSHALIFVGQGFRR